MRTPALLFIGALALSALFIGVKLFVPAPPALPTELSVDEAVRVATLDVSVYGGTTVTLVDGKGSFATTPDATAPQGTVTLMGNPAAIYKGESADVYAVYAINGGGTGTFVTLYRFEYGAGVLTEVEHVALGDRIMFDDVTVNQTAPTAYDVLVSIRDRKVGEAMATVPSQPFVLHYTPSSDGLILKEVLVGTLPTPEAVLTAPLPGATLGHTFTVTGAARGGWFFEGSLPVQVRDMNNNVVASAPAQAQGDWMTAELVPFAVTITVPTTTVGAVALVVKNDNPSGMPENEKSFEIPLLVQ
jgi:hypothetical protein